MSRIKNKRLTMGILIYFTNVLCIFTAVMILLDENKPRYYNFLWVLPLIYMIFFCLIMNYFSAFKYKISAILIITIYGLRMVGVPLAMSVGNYSTYGSSDTLEEYMEMALLLMCWEFIVVAVFLLTQYWKKNKFLSSEECDVNKNSAFYVTGLPWKLKFAIFMVALYIIVILIGTPGLLKESFFLTTGRSDESYALYFSGTVSHKAFGLSFGSLLVTVAFTFFWVLQALLPPYLLTRICVKVRSKIVRNGMYLIVLMGTLLICTEGRAHSIECALALMLTTACALKDRIRVKPEVWIVGLVAVTLWGLMDKSGVSSADGNAFSKFSTMLSAYCSGPQNVAVAIAASEQSGLMGLRNIITDFLQRIPYVTKFTTAWFGGTSNVIFNQYFGNRYLGQIIPSVGLGYSYCGFLLAPLIPCIGVAFSLYFEKKAQSVQDIVSKNLYFLGVIMMARTTAMSNMLSGITYLGNFIFAWIILYFGFYGRKKRGQSDGAGE